MMRAGGLSRELKAQNRKGGFKPPGSRATPRDQPSGRSRDGAPSYDKGNNIAQHAPLPNEGCANHNPCPGTRQAGTRPAGVGAMELLAPRDVTPSERTCKRTRYAKRLQEVIRLFQERR